MKGTIPDNSSQWIRARSFKQFCSADHPPARGSQYPGAQSPLSVQCTHRICPMVLMWGFESTQGTELSLATTSSAEMRSLSWELYGFFRRQDIVFLTALLPDR